LLSDIADSSLPENGGAYSYGCRAFDPNDFDYRIICRISQVLNPFLSVLKVIVDFYENVYTIRANHPRPAQVLQVGFVLKEVPLYVWHLQY
jgi:hypothetical protein